MQMSARRRVEAPKLLQTSRRFHQIRTAPQVRHLGAPWEVQEAELHVALLDGLDFDVHSQEMGTRQHALIIQCPR